MRLLLGGLLVACCLMANTPAGAETRMRRLATEMGWLSDYEQGLAEARRTCKPLLVVFRCEP